MKMIHKLLGLLILIFALNCKSTQNKADMVKEDIVLIGKGNLYGAGAEGIEKQNSVITDSNLWNALLKKMNSVNNVSNSFSEMNVDFSKHIILAVFDGVKSTGGHSLELEVKPNAENIQVNVIQKAPEGMASTVMTQPFYILKIPKSDLPIVFK